MELDKTRKNEDILANEVKELNGTIAELNREKVNIMREMTLIHEKRVKAENENKKLKDSIEKY